METVHLLISGKVQGVFFRETSRKIAADCQVKGWIKNTIDGRVEAMITGKKEDLSRFIRWCRSGPEKALVSDVAVSAQEEIHFEDYEVIRGK